MSTTTTNFNLVKPELTDAADITAMNPNWDTIDTYLGKDKLPVVTATSTDGTIYTATVDGVTALTVGLTLIIVPDKTSTSTNVTLNVNGLGAKPVRLPLSWNTTAVATPTQTSWLSANKPIKVCYDGIYWKTELYRISGSDLYGTVPVASGGTGVTSLEDLKTALNITTQEVLYETSINKTSSSLNGNVVDNLLTIPDSVKNTILSNLYNPLFFQFEGFLTITASAGYTSNGVILSISSSSTESGSLSIFSYSTLRTNETINYNAVMPIYLFQGNLSGDTNSSAGYAQSRNDSSHTYYYTFNSSSDCYLNLTCNRHDCELTGTFRILGVHSL